MPRRKKKVYNRPKKLYDKALMDEENKLIKKYGLKSRREVWKADFAVAKIRNIAKNLITAEQKEKENFVNRQIEKGFSVSNIADVLGLDKEKYLERRLQSLLVKKGLVKATKQARQLITHKHVKINGRTVDSPSKIVGLDEENSIEIILAMPIKETISIEEKEILAKIKPKEEKS